MSMEATEDGGSDHFLIVSELDMLAVFIPSVLLGESEVDKVYPAAALLELELADHEVGGFDVPVEVSYLMQPLQAL